MFDNIGRKIKFVASLICWVGIIGCFVLGGILLDDAYYDIEYVIGYVILIGGPIISWVSSFFMYGFGELIEETSGIHSILCTKFCVQIQGNKIDKEKKLDEWKSKGLITEGEYQSKKAQLESEVHE